MLAAFQSHIKKQFPFLRGAKLLIACSGGLDSTVLSILAKESDLDFSLVHCNFGLREKEGDEDEQFVKQLSKDLGVVLYTKTFDTKKEKQQLGGSIQMVARDLRYKWFQELLESGEYSYLLTAHHADDSLETFLINLSRGTGIVGLTGIPYKNGSIVRPLLPFSRAAILAYAESNKLTWREDSSNTETKYLRNQIRHAIIPKLKETNGNFLSNFLNTQQRLRESSLILERTKKELQKTLFVYEGNTVIISIKALQRLDPLSSYLYLLFQEYEFTAWEDILNLLNAESGKEVRSTTHRLLKDRERLLLAPISEEIQSEFYIKSDCTAINKPLKLSIEKVVKVSETHENILYIDIEKLNFPLMLRKWHNGDYFYPLGMKGKKKLSKYFKDEKVAIIGKEEQWLLCSGSEIVWVIGRRADERFKITPATKQIVKIVWHK
ncbi:tRNA lysidine(34) synthetase TilS [uncultured Croceitalea sp.]|uniref:tRNA lysidine(34) synthetase TilS n=1 Tax=uncultured Croceitalea sp. TaxID=1798908 RepID=UPI0033061A65